LSDILAKVRWSLFERCLIAARKKCFWASTWSFADKNCQFDAYVRLYKGVFLRSVKVGKASYISRNTQAGFASIGNYCSIGPEVIIGGLGKHPVNQLSTHPAFYSPHLRAGISFVNSETFEELPHTMIGSDVWIGVRAIILDGVTVGDGAVIAAGALVNKNVPPYAVVAGVPARVIRYRFDEQVIDVLLNWKWWNLPEENVQKISAVLEQKEVWRVDEIKQLIAQCSV